jgi:hypothetical protein
MSGMTITNRAAGNARAPLPTHPRVDCAACPDGLARDIHPTFY